MKPDSFIWREFGIPHRVTTQYSAPWTATTSIAFCDEKDADIVETAYSKDLERYNVLRPETKKMIEDISLGRDVGPHAGEPDSY